MASPLKVEFQFDFGSPNAYLAELALPAVNRGAFGSPTFFVGKEMFFGKDQLRDVEESIVEQTRPLPKTA